MQAQKTSAAVTIVTLDLFQGPASSLAVVNGMDAETSSA
jgi:hypothetical protein